MGISMVKMDTEGYGACNTTLGGIATAIEASITSYITAIDEMLANNQMGDTRAGQMEYVQDYIKSAVQGNLQEIETTKNTILSSLIEEEAGTDIFI